jgi:hypothetical protein
MQVTANVKPSLQLQQDIKQSVHFAAYFASPVSSSKFCCSCNHVFSERFASDAEQKQQVTLQLKASIDATKYDITYLIC